MSYYPALFGSNRNRRLNISHVAAKIIGLPTPTLSEMIDQQLVLSLISLSIHTFMFFRLKGGTGAWNAKGFGIAGLLIVPEGIIMLKQSY